MKHISMLEMRQNKAERVQLYRDSVRHRDTLPRLVRLADNLLLAAVVEAASASMQAVAALVTDKAKARGVFHCQLFFGNGPGLFVFSPSPETLRAAIVGNGEAIVEVRSSTASSC